MNIERITKERSSFCYKLKHFLMCKKYNKVASKAVRRNSVREKTQEHQHDEDQMEEEEQDDDEIEDCSDCEIVDN